MTVVYLDRVWALNTAIDYLLLLGTARLSGLPLRRGWLLLWAALGGAYAVAVFLPGMTLLGHPLCRLAIGLIIALGAFRRRWRQAALFFLLAGGLAGVVLALGLAAALLPLLVLKYSGMLVPGLRDLYKPFGLAYYSLQLAGYLLDVWHGRTAPTPSSTRRHSSPGDTSSAPGRDE